MANGGDRTMIDEEEFDPMAELLAEINEGEKPIGKRGRRAVLSRDQVENIRGDERPIAEIAEELGVSKSTVHRAKYHSYHTAAENGAHSYRPAQQKQLPEAQRLAVAKDPRPASEVAAEYYISRAYVYILRAKYNGSANRYDAPLPDEVIDFILDNSDWSDERLASRFTIHHSIIPLVRRDYGDKR